MLAGYILYVFPLFEARKGVKAGAYVSSLGITVIVRARRYDVEILVALSDRCIFHLAAANHKPTAVAMDEQILHGYKQAISSYQQLFL